MPGSVEIVEIKENRAPTVCVGALESVE